YLLAGTSSGFLMLAAALVIGGLGSSVQHPIASSLVAQAFEGRRSRAALASYNFAGDIGKMAFPAVTAWLIAVMPLRSATMLLGLFGLLAAAVILLLLPRSAAAASAERPVAASAEPEAASGRFGGGFWMLLGIGILDSGTRMGFL